MKAVVIAVIKQRAAVLLKNGDMRYVENRGYTKGSILELPESPLISSVPGSGGAGFLHFPRRIARSAAASFALLFLTGAMVSYACPVSRLPLDSDPAISLAVNCYGRVVEVNSENEENEEIIREIGTRLSGKSVGEASAILTGLVRDEAKAGSGGKEAAKTIDEDTSADNTGEGPFPEKEGSGDTDADRKSGAVSINMPAISADSPVGGSDGHPPLEDREKEGNSGIDKKAPTPEEESEEKQGEKPVEKAPGKGDLTQEDMGPPKENALPPTQQNSGEAPKDDGAALPGQGQGELPQQNSGEAPKDAGTALPGQGQGELPQQDGGSPVGQDNSFLPPQDGGATQQDGGAAPQDNGTTQQDSGAIHQDSGGPPEQDNNGGPPVDMGGREHRGDDGGPSGDRGNAGPGD